MDENTAPTTRLIVEAFGEGKLELVDEVVAPDFIDHGWVWPGMPVGPEGLRVFMAAVRLAIPDLRVGIDHVLVAGDLVALFVSSRGTVRGQVRGQPATSHQARWDALHIHRLRGGKIIEQWVWEPHAAGLSVCRPRRSCPDTNPDPGDPWVSCGGTNGDGSGAA